MGTDRMCRVNGEFKEDSLIILRADDPKSRILNGSAETYARIVEIDREANTVKLDAYHDYGRECNHIANVNADLSLIEKDYELMTSPEILAFRDGLTDLTSGEHAAYSAETAKTLDVVNEAAEKVEEMLKNKDREL